MPNVRNTDATDLSEIEIDCSLASADTALLPMHMVPVNPQDNYITLAAQLAFHT